MDALSMMRVAVVLLAISAAGGLVMALIRFARKVNPPAWLAMVHGFLVAAAFALLAYASLVFGVPPMANIAIVLFVLAALGGVVMNLGYQWKQRLIPSMFVIGHAVLAVAGFGCLVMATYGN